MHASNNVACECFKGSGTAWELKFLGERAMKKYLKGFLGLSLCAGLATLAYAAVDFDPATGTGFVGKGDVQLIYGWNNKQLQENVDKVRFQAVTKFERTATWVCSDASKSGEKEQVKNARGAVTAVARLKNQITGWSLNGYDPNKQSSTLTASGSIGNCPGSGNVLVGEVQYSEWEFVSGGLEVSTDGDIWTDVE
jgi:hypothetical protein